MPRDVATDGSRGRRLTEPVHDDGNVAIGTFRCPVDEPTFEDTGPIERFLVVFPRTSVWIQYRDGDRFVADPTLVTIYNRGQSYRRFPISADGDRCEWWALSRELACEVAASVDPATTDAAEHPYRWQRARSDAALYRDQRRLFRRVRSGSAEPLEVEEGVLDIVRRVLRAALREGGNDAPRPLSRRRSAELAEAARAAIARRLDTPVRLADLSRPLGVSPFHLAHVFRRESGGSLHATRLEIRLRVALERVADPCADLAAVALDLGFSSHSHFSAAFRRRFGVAPSDWRRLGRSERQGRLVPGRRT